MRVLVLSIFLNLFVLSEPNFRTEDAQKSLIQAILLYIRLKSQAKDGVIERKTAQNLDQWKRVSSAHLEMKKELKNWIQSLQENV